MEALIIWCIFKYRRRADDRTEAPQVYGSNPIELAWTVVPTLIVFVLFLVSARTIFEIDKTTPPEGSLEITVIGHQWWWEFDYPEYGFITANELHVPLTRDGNPVPIYLTLESNDGRVVESWVLALSNLDTNRAHFDNVTRTYLVRLSLPKQDMPERAELLATLVLPDGERLSAAGEVGAAPKPREPKTVDSQE